jgi:hypothetical protein
MSDEELRLARLERATVANHAMLVLLIEALHEVPFTGSGVKKLFDLREASVADIKAIKCDLAIAALPGDLNDE